MACSDEDKDGKKPRTSVSFAGCGFMGMYHVGIGMCIQEHAEEHFASLNKWYGASAGSIVSVGAACKIRATEGYKFIRKLHDEVYKYKHIGRFGAFHPSFDLMGYVREFLENQLPPDAHRLCRNRVGVSLTVLPSLTNWIVTDFNTRAELIQAVVCSCFIPLFAGIKPPKFRGKMCCDGGLSNNLPYSCNPDVITVSPFSGECDICPNGETETHVLVNMFNQPVQSSWKNIYRGFGAVVFFPWEEMDKICAQGFHDAYKFIKREGIELTSFPVLEPILSSVVIDSDYTDTSCSQTHSRQASSVGCLDELLDELEERRDSSILFVEEELSEPVTIGDDDSGIFLNRATVPPRFELRWKIKSKALFRNGVSSVSNKWHSFLETVSEYQHQSSSVSLDNGGSPCTSSTSFLPLPITS